MAQLRHYYTLSWTSRSGVNRGGRRGLARPPFPSRPDLKPWLLLSLTHFTLPMCPDSAQDTRRVSLTRLQHAHTHALTHIHTHTHLDTVLSPSSRQKHGIVSHVSASSCATGAMWGLVQPSDGWGRGEIVRGWGVVCGHLSSVCSFYPSLLVAPHEGTHLPTASHRRGPERP